MSLVLGLSVLTACAPAPVVTVTDEQINAAQDAGELERLYRDTALQLAAFDRQSRPEDFARLDAIGKQLASVKAAQVRARMQRFALSEDLIPMNILAEAAADAEQIRGWNTAIGDALSNEISLAREASQAAFDEARNRQAALPADAHRERLAVLEEMAAVSGDPSYENQRAALVQSLAQQAAAAQEAENLEQAKELLDALPDNADTRQQRAEVDRRLFEKRFNKALADNRPDEAYQHFAALAAAPNWNDIKPDMREIGQVMIDYFTALGSDATGKGQLADAKRWLLQASHMAAALGLDAPREAFNPFVDKVKALASKARNSGKRPAQELGLLYLVDQLQPGRGDVTGRINELQNAIAAIAPREVSTTAFRDPSGDYKFGDKIAAGITQYLFKSIPQDVRIIEREQYEAIKREQDLRGASSLTSVDYLITGSVLEAKVEDTQQKNRRTMRVVTETGTRPNPAYLEWLKLTESQQDRIKAPAETESYETREDVSINVTIHRKVGIFSVSYRLIDAHSGKVIFPDSVTESIEFSDESTEGVQLGDFTLDFKLADLPSDVEILNELAAKISEEIGGKLTERLSRQEEAYASSATAAASEGHYLKATELMARAEAIALRKGLDASELREHLINHAMADSLGLPAPRELVAPTIPAIEKPVLNTGPAQSQSAAAAE
ncbi:MAG: hypothetical protein CMN84_05230 [Spongiibacteraceae bacterium]|nr:hypothetical protein [Spongiibacteraceae bacterium]